MRIEKIRDYMFNIIDSLINNTSYHYQINADFLGNVGDFSLNKIPTDPKVESWIIGKSKKKDVYSFRSRKAYSRDTINNLQNIGFFEDLENKINSNNKNGILPDIENVESIECLSCGCLNIANTNDATFDIQLQITYLENEETGGISL